MWLWICFSLCMGTSQALECRKLFHESYDNEKSCLSLIEKTNAINEKSTALLMGYKGAALMMQSKYKKGAVTKLALFSNGKTWLEKAIKKDAVSLELRYIRFCFQSTVPSLLKYAADIEKDKKLILQKAQNCTDADLKSKIRNFMLKSNKVTEEEKAIIKSKWSK